MNGRDDPILCAIDGHGVASVTLNRPAVNDAQNSALIDAVIETKAQAPAVSGRRLIKVSARQYSL